jgi:hypothetical protein
LFGLSFSGCAQLFKHFGSFCKRQIVGDVLEVTPRMFLLRSWKASQQKRQLLNPEPVLTLSTDSYAL